MTDVKDDGGRSSGASGKSGTPTARGTLAESATSIPRHFQRLPPSMLADIVTLLGLRDALSCTAVCRAWNKAIKLGASGKWQATVLAELRGIAAAGGLVSTLAGGPESGLRGSGALRGHEDGVSRSDSEALLALHKEALATVEPGVPFLLMLRARRPPPSSGCVIHDAFVTGSCRKLGARVSLPRRRFALSLLQAHKLPTSTRVALNLPWPPVPVEARVSALRPHIKAAARHGRALVLSKRSIPSNADLSEEVIGQLLHEEATVRSTIDPADAAAEGAASAIAEALWAPVVLGELPRWSPRGDIARPWHSYSFATLSEIARRKLVALTCSFRASRYSQRVMDKRAWRWRRGLAPARVACDISTGTVLDVDPGTWRVSPSCPAFQAYADRLVACTENVRAVDMSFSVLGLADAVQVNFDYAAYPVDADDDLATGNVLIFGRLRFSVRLPGRLAMHRVTQSGNAGGAGGPASDAVDERPTIVQLGQKGGIWTGDLWPVRDPEAFAADPDALAADTYTPAADELNSCDGDVPDGNAPPMIQQECQNIAQCLVGLGAVLGLGNGVDHGHDGEGTPEDAASVPWWALWRWLAAVIGDPAFDKYVRETLSDGILATEVARLRCHYKPARQLSEESRGAPRKKRNRKRGSRRYRRPRDRTELPEDVGGAGSSGDAAGDAGGAAAPAAE